MPNSIFPKNRIGGLKKPGSPLARGSSRAQQVIEPGEAAVGHDRVQGR